MPSLKFEIDAQPDDVTCGPTCLHAIYRYFGDDIELGQVIAEVDRLNHGGTLDVYLANHALKRGYQATLISFNHKLFDPTWFSLSRKELRDRLAKQARVKRSRALADVTRGYLEFLDLGGKVTWQELRSALLRRYLKRNLPIMTGLSATYLYRSVRELPDTNQEDDIRGEPVGHFVVLSGYQRETRQVRIADPWRKNPYSPSGYYDVAMPRLIASILLGVITYDANLLIIKPDTAKMPESVEADSA